MRRYRSLRCTGRFLMAGAANVCILAAFAQEPQSQHYYREDFPADELRARRHQMLETIGLDAAT